MQNPSSSVSSGTISPAIVGTDKGTKEVYVIGGVVLGLAIVVGAFWYYSGQGQSYVSNIPAETLSSAQVTNVLKASTALPVEPIVHSQTIPAASIVRQHPYRYLFRGGPQGTDRRRQGHPRDTGRLGEERSRPRYSRPGLYRPAGLSQLQPQAGADAG